MSRLPDFLYIGPSKAGSTWIFDVLSRHPEIYMAPGKGLHFFSSHYEWGIDWYRAQFQGARAAAIIGEVSHSYLASPAACLRIASLEPKPRLIVCLREPVQRAFSDYLDGVKNFEIQGPFEAALDLHPGLMNEGRYARHLTPYLAHFGRPRLHIGIFDRLLTDPDRFAAELFAFLGVSPRPLARGQRRAMLPAGRPRSRALVMLAKRVSHAARRLGLRGLRARAKTSRGLRRALYHPFSPDERPQMSWETRERLRREFQSEVQALDELLGSDFSRLWGYRP